jgi:hypothetical protein
MIKIDKERYLKHTIIDLETPNEPVSTNFPVLENYSWDIHFREFSPLLSTIPFTQNYEIIFQEEQLTPIGNALFCQSPTIELTGQEIGKQEINIEKGKRDCLSHICTLYFHGSKSQEGSGAGCILINPKGRHYFLSCRLEFKCTNNIVEYEALVQGLRKAIDLGVKELKVFGDFEIIVRKVRNTIH